MLLNIFENIIKSIFAYLWLLCTPLAEAIYWRPQPLEDKCNFDFLVPTSNQSTTASFSKGILQFFVFRMGSQYFLMKWNILWRKVTAHLLGSFQLCGQSDKVLRGVWTNMMDMVFTCVDMVSNVVTPKATLAGTERLSSQKETWWIFYVYPDTPKNINFLTAYLL